MITKDDVNAFRVNVGRMFNEDKIELEEWWKMREIADLLEDQAKRITYLEEQVSALLNEALK